MCDELMIKLRQIAGAVCAMMTCWAGAPESSSIDDPLLLARCRTEGIVDSIENKFHKALYNSVRPEARSPSIVAIIKGEATDEQKEEEVTVGLWPLIRKKTH
jgi:hypothetical protein